MNPPRDISTASDPDLRAALTALYRASRLARRIAIQTGTDLVVVRDGRIARVPPEALRREVEHESDPARD